MLENANVRVFFTFTVTLDSYKYCDLKMSVTIKTLFRLEEDYVY